MWNDVYCQLMSQLYKKISTNGFPLLYLFVTVLLNTSDFCLLVFHFRWLNSVMSITITEKHPIFRIECVTTEAHGK